MFGGDLHHVIGGKAHNACHIPADSHRPPCQLAGENVGTDRLEAEKALLRHVIDHQGRLIHMGGKQQSGFSCSTRVMGNHIADIIYLVGAADGFQLGRDGLADLLLPAGRAAALAQLFQ